MARPYQRVHPWRSALFGEAGILVPELMIFPASSMSVIDHVRSVFSSTTTAILTVGTGHWATVEVPPSLSLDTRRLREYVPRMSGLFGRLMPVVGGMLLIVSCGAGPEAVSSTGAPTALSGPASTQTLIGQVADPTVSPISPTDAGRSVSVQVTDGVAVEPSGKTVSAQRLVFAGRTVELAAQPGDGLAGSLVPWVVPDPSAERLYYTMWEDRQDLDVDTNPDLKIGDVGGVPVIRQVDLTDGTDTVFRRGSYSVAVASDGRVAYVEDLDGAYRFSVDNPNRVIVSTPAGDEVWSTDEVSKYFTMGWAGDVLIVYQTNEGGYLRILAFDGPGETRVLSEGGDVGAISPDGSEVLIIEPGDAGSRFLIVDPADGSLKAALGPDSEPQLESVGAFHGGDWTGHRIVVPYGGRYSPTGGGIVSLTRDEDFKLDRVVTLDIAGLSTVHPQMVLDPTGSVWMVVSTVESDTYSYVEVMCDLDARECRTVSDPMDPRTTAIVGNPSSEEGLGS